MTTGGKIAIAGSILVVVSVGIYFVFKAATDNKEREVRDAEEGQFGSLGDLIENARKKHPKLGEWYDNLALTGSKAIEDGWLIMTEEQKKWISDGLKQQPMTPDVESFFTKKGYKK
jgi:hypothetical protein